MIISGGAGSKDDVLNLLSFEHVSGIAISSILHYDYLKTHDLKNLKYEVGNIDFLMNEYKSNKFETINIKELKYYLKSKNIKINLL